MDKKMVIKDFSAFYENCISDHKKYWAMMKKILIEDPELYVYEIFYQMNIVDIRRLKTEAFDAVFDSDNKFSSVDAIDRRAFLTSGGCFFCWFAMRYRDYTGKTNTTHKCRLCPHRPYRDFTTLNACIMGTLFPYAKLIERSFHHNLDEVVALMDEIINLPVSFPAGVDPDEEVIID